MADYNHPFVKISLSLKGQITDDEIKDFNKNFFNNVEYVTGVDLSKYFRKKKVDMKLATLPGVTEDKNLYSIDISKETKVYIPQGGKQSDYYITNNAKMREEQISEILGSLRYYYEAADVKNVSTQIMQITNRAVNTYGILYWQPPYKQFGYIKTYERILKNDPNFENFKNWINDISMKFFNTILEKIEETEKQMIIIEEKEKKEKEEMEKKREEFLKKKEQEKEEEAD